MRRSQPGQTDRCAGHCQTDRCPPTWRLTFLNCIPSMHMEFDVVTDHKGLECDGRDKIRRMYEVCFLFDRSNVISSTWKFFFSAGNWFITSTTKRRCSTVKCFKNMQTNIVFGHAKNMQNQLSTEFGFATDHSTQSLFDSSSLWAFSSTKRGSICTLSPSK